VPAPFRRSIDDLRTLTHHWLGHRAIQHTARYTELSPTRFKDVWR
jgi:site-specific recombinase XerD